MQHRLSKDKIQMMRTTMPEIYINQESYLFVFVSKNDIVNAFNRKYCQNNFKRYNYLKCLELLLSSQLL